MLTLQIHYRDSRPIYEQLRDELKAMLVSGAYGAGEKLPSVRELATELAINPNTIQRTYRELENEGYIVSLPGKGSFAGEQADTLRLHRKALLDDFDKAAASLLEISVSREELISHLKEREENHD